MGTLTEDIRFSGSITMSNLVVTGATLTNDAMSANAAIARSKLAQDTFQPFTVPLTQFRTWNALATNLPGTAASDDLELSDGTFGTGAPVLSAGDIGGTASTRYARAHIVIPAEYDDGESVSIRLHAGVATTVCDTSCTVDVQAYRPDESGGISADLCTTAAQSCNSLTFADYDFVITPTTITSGDTLDVRVAITYSDTGDAGVMTPTIGAVQLLCDIRG